MNRPSRSSRSAAAQPPTQLRTLLDGRGPSEGRGVDAGGSADRPLQVRYQTFAEDGDGDVTFYFRDPETGEQRRSSPIRDVVKLNYCRLGRPEAANLAWYRIETVSGSHYAVLLPKKHVAEIVDLLSRRGAAGG